LRKLGEEKEPVEESDSERIMNFIRTQKDIVYDMQSDILVACREKGIKFNNPHR
jgi:hypothetical protein